MTNPFFLSVESWTRKEEDWQKRKATKVGLIVVKVNAHKKYSRVVLT